MIQVEEPLLPMLLPGALPALLLAPALWWLLRSLDGARSRRLERMVGPRASVLAAELGRDRRRLRTTLAAGALLFAVVAVVQPAWGIDPRKVEQRGVDILVCLDVSRSMLARDLPPSRLERAKREIRSLSERVRGDRLGLVVFAGDARLRVPLTRDTDSYADLVDATGPLDVPRGGTDLGAALAAALEALAGRSGQHEVIVLITDGEDHGQRGRDAAAECRARGIAVHCVGIGTALGSKIVVPGESGESFLRDAAGDEVVSAMDAAALRAVAEAGGGAFVDASTSPRPLVELYEDEVVPMAATALASDASRGRENRFQWPLLLALLLWLVELSLSDKRGARRRRA